MAMIQSGLTLVSKFLPLSIMENGDMTVTLHTGWYEDGVWHERGAETYVMPATDVAAFMQHPGDSTKSRYEDITTILCQYALDKGHAKGVIVAEPLPA
jgi:hypothetical protein